MTDASIASFRRYSAWENEISVKEAAACLMDQGGKHLKEHQEQYDRQKHPKIMQ
jgi:hypothetical protein